MKNIRTLVVVSFYNARPQDALDMLLWQLKHIPAGMPFDILVMVNRAVDQDLSIAGKYAGVEVAYRENAGFNIGAWDAAWRLRPDYDAYVFLQDECLIARRHWLESLVSVAMRGNGALVGESLVDPAQTWEDSQASYEAFYAAQGYTAERWDVDEGDLHTPMSTRNFLAAWRIHCQPTMRHVRSLALCAPGRLLEATDGFPIGTSYREAVAAEIGISQRALARGFRVRQAALLPYTFVMHPQWMTERCEARSLRGVARHAAQRLVPASMRLKLRARRFSARPRGADTALQGPAAR